MQNLPAAAEIDCLLFDLDGTLVDTAADLCQAMQTLLQQHGRPAVDEERFRSVVSDGSYAMICLAFELEADDSQVEALRAQFLKIYRGQLSAYSHLFEGMEAVLEHCQRLGKRWGIITNKPEHLTLPLLEQLSFPYAPSTIVCGDTTAAPKPSPLPMNKAMADVAVNANRCLYFGDASRDIEAARNVDMPSVAVSWGYIQSDDDINDWQADCIIHHPDEITAWLTAN
jgi:phosphoglycolate phosphatase